MTGFAKLWVVSRKIGFIATATCVLVWLVGGALVANMVGQHDWRYISVGNLVALLLSITIGIGGLIGFWLIADHVEFFWLGYRIDWVAGNEWSYDERAEGTIRSLPFVRVTVGEGYPAPCEVHIASESSWEASVPSWASGRRSEIMKRIATYCGSDVGGHITFVEL